MADSVNEIEKYLNEQYAIAQKEVEKKLKAFMKKYKQLDKQKKKDVKSGKITEEEYNQWRVNKILCSMHWVNLLDNIAGDMLRTNRMAVDYINGKVPDLFINAFNNLQRDIPVGPVEGYSFELINKDTVAQLVKGNEIMLPPPKDIDKYKDKQWNKKNVNSAVLQGILQGESMDAIAKRVAKSTAEKNHAVALRNARTMVTAAENSGRAASIKRAERDGVILDKIWLATSDSRTRDSHASMNGERIPSEKAFSNGLMFPGDWSTNNPSEVYNCRCTLVTKFVTFDNKRFKQSVKNRKQAVVTENIKGVVDKAMKVYGFNEDGRFFMERVEEALTNADNKYTELYNYYIANTKFTYSGDGCYFDPDSKSVNIDMTNVDDYTHESFLHEIGHRILDDNADILDRYKEKIHNAIEADSETMMKYVVEKYCPEYIDKWHKGKYGYYFDYYNEKRDRMQQDYDSAEKELNNALYFFLSESKKEIAKNDDYNSFMSFSRFSDTIDGLTDGHFNKIGFFGGHGEQYYWGNEENIIHEFFANNIALETLERKSISELTKNYSPELYSVYSEMLSEIIERGKK